MQGSRLGLGWVWGLELRIKDKGLDGGGWEWGRVDMAVDARMNSLGVGVAVFCLSRPV